MKLLIAIAALSPAAALARSRGGEGGLLGLALVIGAIGMVIWLFGRMLAPNQSMETRAFIGLFALAGVATLVEIVKTFL
jgi:hypothetical protein